MITRKFLSNFVLVAIVVVTKLESTNSTKIKWTGNDSGPEASKVPRSQKYWDENNIQRPDYAKTDAELMQERVKKYTVGSSTNENSADSLNMKDTHKGVMGFLGMGTTFAFYAALCTIIIRMVVGKSVLPSGLVGGGSKLGSSSTAISELWVGKGSQSPEEKARLARLAKFDVKRE